MPQRRSNPSRVWSGARPSDRASRALTPGGLFVQWDWEMEPEAPEPFGLSREQVRRALEGAELEIIALDTAFSVSVSEHEMSPLMGAARRRA